MHLALYRAAGTLAQQQEAVRALETAVKHWEAYAAAASTQYHPQLLARTRVNDWWKIFEDVKRDVVIARDDIRQ